METKETQLDGQDRIESQPATGYDPTPTVESSPHEPNERRRAQLEQLADILACIFIEISKNDPDGGCAK